MSRFAVPLVFSYMKSPPISPASATCASNLPRDETDGLSPTGSSHDMLIAELFTKYHAKLVKSLVARMGCWEEASDIASQAFAEVLAQRPGTVGFLGPYLYRTARNLAMNRLTHDAMRKRKAPIVGYEPRSEPSPEPLWEEREHAAILQQAIGGLSPRLRMAFVLRIWDELSYEEIASRFATDGVKLNVRTLQRYVAEAFEHCRRRILAAQTPSAEEPK